MEQVTLARRASLVCGSVLLAAACGHTTPPHGAVDMRNSPGAVALEYGKAMFAGRFDQAARWVLPAQVGTLRALTLGLPAGSVQARDLAVGSTSTSGGSAVVVLTGTLCRSGAPTKASSPGMECVTNRDARSTNPIFRIQLAQDTRHQWFVTYPDPGQNGQPVPSSGASSPAV
ncbi:hypothetical protein [Actinomadura rupiterrae]|uniref:hypothetical protein n=1 Tax=Actinomadura rupiterrae TaxID=559627 RepID=UPI0020A5361C|nr:hypothetical protein [Actinomadura rupiterrae]MCP2343842.1 hypothetical protein [Actinomadura rupiterrae]